MTDATKLKNLLNKTKPSIQYEVRKKKPTTTLEFLEFAKEAEELMQLSNMTFSESNYPTNASYMRSSPLSMRPTVSNSSSYYPSQSSRAFNPNPRFATNRNIPSSSQDSSFSRNYAPQNASRTSYNSTLSSQNKNSTTASNQTYTRPNVPLSNSPRA
ncbi:unnamed protein product, partial [Adineta ricciae]